MLTLNRNRAAEILTSARGRRIVVLSDVMLATLATAMAKGASIKETAVLANHRRASLLLNWEPLRQMRKTS